MTRAASRPHILPHIQRHTGFLKRMAAAPSPSSIEARLAEGALLTLRLVDLLGPERDSLAPEAFHYQRVAIEKFCHELPRDCTETAHLRGLVRSAADACATRDIRFVVPALLAYSHYLEEELRLDPARDVLATLLRVAGDKLGSGDGVAARLRMARVLRKLTEFDAAEETYLDAEALAAASGDPRSELLSRIGRAHAVTGRGNLAEAERALRQILVDAGGLRDRDAQARAHQGIAVVLSTGGQPAEAIPHAWRAFQLYEDELSRTRALGDVGVMLLVVGDAEGAERALTEVLRLGGTRETVNNALIELMHCASYRRDRLGFERRREQCDTHRESMPPNILVDFNLKTAIGRARFGQYDRAEILMETALSIAEAAGLHEFVFRIERIKNGLRDCQAALSAAPGPVAEPFLQSEAVREVSASLPHLDA